MPQTLTPTQQAALDLLKQHSPLDYQTKTWCFAPPEAARGEGIQMQTAKALINRGLVIATRYKPSPRGDLIDQISLPEK